MKSIEELEREISLQLKIAQEKKEWAKVTNLGLLGQSLTKVKDELERIDKSIFPSQHAPLDNEESVEVEITEGAIRQNVLSIAKMKRRGLIPTDGKSFNIETSMGDSFQTNITNNSMLSARGKIREFYKKAVIVGGDRIIWKQIGPSHYHLSKM
jgi:hypothetical protein